MSLISSFKWKISDVQAKLSRGHIASPYFTSKAGKSWALGFYAEVDEELSDEIKLVLCLGRSECETKVFIRIYFIDANGNWNDVNRESKIQQYSLRPEQEYPMAIKRISTASEDQSLSSYMSGQSLTIVIQLLEMPDCPNFITEEIKRFYEEQRLFDFHFKVQDNVIPAHKLVLAASSPVLCAMFESSMAEAVTNSVQIQDFSVDAVRAMVNLLYDVDVENLELLSLDLLSLSNKYLIKQLKLFLENYFILNLDIDNVLLFYKLAIQFQAIELKAHSVRYFCRNRRLIVPTEQFQNYDAEVCKEILSHMCSLCECDY